jgi:hypothetical protein
MPSGHREDRLETGKTFCIHCGTENPPASKFCYKCGKPIPAAPSVSAPLPIPEQPPAVLTLSCPTCGGKLQVTPEITRFACMYCGNEHIVRRGNGATTIEPVLRELQAVRQDLGHVQQSGVEVIRQAGNTVQAAQAAQNSAAYLAQRGTVMQQISLVDRSLEDKRKQKTELEKSSGSLWIGASIGLGIGSVIIYSILESTDETLAITFAMICGMVAVASFFVGVFQAISYGSKKREVEMLKKDIASLENQLNQLRSQIH